MRTPWSWPSRASMALRQLEERAAIITAGYAFRRRTARRGRTTSAVACCPSWSMWVETDRWGRGLFAFSPETGALEESVRGIRRAGFGAVRAKKADIGGSA